MENYANFCKIFEGRANLVATVNLKHLSIMAKYYSIIIIQLF